MQWQALSRECCRWGWGVKSDISPSVSFQKVTVWWVALKVEGAPPCTDYFNINVKTQVCTKYTRAGEETSESNSS